MESKHSHGPSLGAKASKFDGEISEGKETKDSPRLHRDEPKASASHIIGSKSEGRAAKAAMLEAELDEEVDQEFEALLRKPNVGKAVISDNPEARRIAAGLRINNMVMKDAISGKIIWESNRFGANMFTEEMEGLSI